MAKLRRLSGKEVCKILESEGFTGVRQKGSHIIMQKKLLDDSITVPVPNHKELAIGTLSGIIQQSRVPRQLFEV